MNENSKLMKCLSIKWNTLQCHTMWVGSWLYSKILDSADKKLSWDKHSSLFWPAVSGDEKDFL
jgi:hypothetical protein